MEENEKTPYDTSDHYGCIEDKRVYQLELQEEIGIFAKKIKETNIYHNYLVQTERVKKKPELKIKIDEFRLKNFELQSTTDSDELFDKTDSLLAEYENFRADPMVDAFLTAELEFCRMMQKVYQSISENVYFD